MRLCICLFAILAVVALPARHASAYPVAASLPLPELEKAADFIGKVEAGESQPAQPSPYRDVSGFEAVATKLKVIETYKGADVGNEIEFIHYAPKKGTFPMMYMPQNYQLDLGKSYILFAKKTDRDGVYQQLWENHKSKDDQGLVRALDNSQHGTHPLRDIIWSELAKLLASADRDDVLYAIVQLDQMSGGGYDHLTDFDRFAALTAIEPMMRCPDKEIATSAIQALGSRSPYLSPDYAPGWLATVGKGSIPGYAKWEVPESSPARDFWQSFVDVANSDAQPELRALAVSALGRTKVPATSEHLSRWLVDPAPQVRQAAAVLLADYPDLATEETIELLASDPEPIVRVGVARAIGFGQWPAQVTRLGRMLKDKDATVTQAAAMSLLSLPIKESQPILEVNLDTEYRPVFINALAEQNPEKYLNDLADIIRNKREPEHWWGGSIPWGVSWNILFRYAQTHPDKLKGGQLNDSLDALESPEYFSSSEPRDLYALYLQNGLTDRAQKLRAACRKRLTYDIDYFFNMVDQNPDGYRRDQ